MSGNAITPEYLEALKKDNLLEKGDFQKLALNSKEKKLRNGKGYTAEQFRNFINKHHTTTIEVVGFIVTFFEGKKKMRSYINNAQINQIEEVAP